MQQPGLKRSLSLPLLTFYGLGTILGAGIYVLIAAVAGEAGGAMPLSFVLAAVIAGFTAFSYAELAARYPRSAGEAVYVDSAFAHRRFTAVVGYAVVFVGITSAATIVRGFTGYLAEFVALPDVWVIVAIVLALGALAACGILEAAAVAATITVVEIGGLVFVVATAGDSLVSLAEPGRLLPGPGGVVGIMSGAFLAFYAFIGFEDMVNVAEEVKSPERNLPRAIVIALVVSTVLYVLVAFAAVAALPSEALALSEAPLADIVRARGIDPAMMAAVSLVAVVNGALVQIIKTARVLYGMAGLGSVPAVFARVSALTRTPVFATAVVTAVVLAFALGLPLVRLAALTSGITLAIFMTVNASLWRLKLRTGPVAGVVSYPLVVPVAGFMLSGVLLAFSFAVAGG